MYIRTDFEKLKAQTLASVTDLDHPSKDVDVLTLQDGQRGGYRAGFAVSPRAIELVQRLRYQVFNLELGEGLASSDLTGLDRDQFDEQMTHLVLLTDTTQIVGTYRMQTVRHALNNKGIYSAGIFDLEGLAPYFPKSVELGRACLAIEHRRFSAIFALWLGIGSFMNLYDQQYLFGCCSLSTQDPDDGWRALKTARQKGYLHDSLLLPAQPHRSCGDPAREHDPALGDAIRLPKLFKTYMKLGTRIVSEPAIDREFGTVDFLTMLDGKKVAMAGLDVLH